MRLRFDCRKNRHRIALTLTTGCQGDRAAVRSEKQVPLADPYPRTPMRSKEQRREFLGSVWSALPLNASGDRIADWMGHDMTAETAYSEGVEALDSKNYGVAFTKLQSAIALFLKEKNIDGVVRAAVSFGYWYEALGLKPQARDLYLYACKLAECSNLCVLTCCQTWWDASWRLGPHGVDDITEANAWIRKAKEAATLAHLDLHNLPREHRTTASPELANPGVEFIIQSMTRVIFAK
jgi:hypothetical protein